MTEATYPSIHKSDSH